MASKSNISWCDATWNPITGCSRVSDGCRNCYAERMAGTRLAHHKHYVHLTRISGGEPKWTGDVRFNEDVLMQPAKWRKPKRIFVNSMGDLFHENVQDEWLLRIYQVMQETPQHTYLILTKRPARMLEWARKLDGGWSNFVRGVPENAWHGVSCENQETADERIPLLLQVPGKVFASCEPLLGAIDLYPYLFCLHKDPWIAMQEGRTRRNALHWVIVGGESGKGYRECEVEWIESIARQCKAAGVPAFVKQDCGLRPGQQGRIPDDLWELKEVPE